MAGQTSQQTPARRPAGVTWLVLLVFILALTHLLGVIDVIERWNLYRLLDMSPPIWVFASLDGVWTVVWISLGTGLWTCREWARRGTLIAVPIYMMLAIGQTVLFAHSPYAHDRLPFRIGLAGFVSVILALVLTRPRIKQVFKTHV